MTLAGSFIWDLVKTKKIHMISKIHDSIVGLLDMWMLGWIRKPKRQPPDRWPTRSNVVEWMDEQVSYHREVYPDSAWNLFSPYCAAYIPLNIHVGYSFDDEARQLYYDLRSKNMDLVEAAKAEALKSSVMTRVFVSKMVGHPDDIV